MLIYNQFTQTVLYHFILDDATLTANFEPGYFDGKNMQICFQFAKSHVLKYHEAPSATQMKQFIQASEHAATVTDDVIDIIYSAKASVKDYAYDWLWDAATTWGSWEHYVAAVKDAAVYAQMNKDEITPENIKEKLERAKGMFNKTCTVDFGNSDKSGTDFWDPESHKQKKMKRSTSGYSYIDHCLKGGYYPGCLICFVGAPKVGKSLWMQNLCVESVKRGEPCLYISLELPEEMINMRMGCNMFSVPSDSYEKMAETEAFAEKVRSVRKSALITPGVLRVKEFPTSTLSTVDLEGWILEEEERLSTPGHPFKFKNVFVDYINIMKNWRNPNTENTYMKIKQIAEDLKAIAIKNGWAMITATQTNRSQFDTNDMTASQVSESSALGATVDAMFGIIADALMQLNGEYFLKCIYDRVAPEANTRKRFINDKEFLRITEDEMSPIENVIPTLVNNGTPHIPSRKQAVQSTEESLRPMSPDSGGGLAPNLLTLDAAPMNAPMAAQGPMINPVGYDLMKIGGKDLF